MRENEKPVLVLQSGTNIDRLASVYCASKRSNRILYEDNYTALIASAEDIQLLKQTVSADEYVTVHTCKAGSQ